MPAYEYTCCGNTITHIRSITDEEKIPHCVTCHKPMTRVFGAPPIHFKGDGFNTKKG
jgi:hypothetical protein